MIIKENIKIGDKTITIETGRIAKQAHGSVLISCGESIVLCTVCGTKEPRPGIDFLPLSVEYVEKTYAAGKIPGGFFKREGKLRNNEVLTSRLIDRPMRPLVPEGYRNEIQVVATVLSADRQNLTDVLALTGCSAALHLSPIPWAGPVAGVRVTRVDGKFVANPTMEELEKGDCDLIIAASADAIVMVEGEANEMSEEDLVEAIFFGQDAVRGVLQLIDRLREAAGLPKWKFEPAPSNETLLGRVRDLIGSDLKATCNIGEKGQRYGKFSELKKHAVATLAAEFPEQEKPIAAAYEDLKYQVMRAQVLEEGRRVDGRDAKTVRPISIEVGLLPRTHGSSLFTRGETQAIVTTTLGTRTDEQKIDGLLEERWERFMLHYNFPPFSVGEVKPMRGPGRREIGHGNLAERAIRKVLPDHEQFPYTLRIVSEITESNGSSSMASVCGGSLALMDGGVPIKKAVAGVAMGLISEGQKYAILTDILGDEDHLGDMDFKVCGTNDGVTAIQMDIKIMGLSKAIMKEALAQAREGRLHVIAKMNEVIAQPRADLSQHAPRITTIKVKPDHIRLIIGPGGKMIKAIVDETGCAINVEDDGTVSIASSDPAAVKRAIEIIETLTIEPEVGKKYKGIVRRVEAYGAFLEIAPGNDGLLHISDFDWKRVEKVEDIMNLGDEVEVVVTNIDRDGKIRLSRKDLLPKPEGWEERPPRERGDRDRDRNGRGGRRDGRDRDRDRGPRRDRGERSESRDFDRDDRGPRRRRGRDDRPEERPADGERREHEDRPERLADDRRDRDDREARRDDRAEPRRDDREGRRDDRAEPRRDDREGRRDRDDRRDRGERSSEGRRDDRAEPRRDDREGRRDDRAEPRRDDREGRRDSSERVEQRVERRDDRRDDRRERDDDREHRSQDKPEPSVD